MEDYIGRWVEHTTKRIKGRIVAQDNFYITVAFTPSGERMDYGYPGCFSKTLRLLDESMSSKMLTERRSSRTTNNKPPSSRRQASNVTSTARKTSMRRRGEKAEVPRYASMNEFYKVQRILLSGEINALKKNSANWIRLFDGKLIGKSDDRFIYLFETDAELFLPNGMPISLKMSDGWNNVSANVESVGDGSVEISCMEDLGREISSVQFKTNTSWLLEALYGHLEGLRSNPSEIVKALVCDGRKKILRDSWINIGQDTACQMSVSQPILFVWGPPGTGKTETLAAIAKKHMKIGNRVLMLSYSNVAVDEAILRVNSRSSTKIPGKLLRYGYPRDEKIREHEYLTPYKYVLFTNPELVEEKEELQDKKRRMVKTSNRYEKNEKRLQEIRTIMREKEKVALENASFVATTVSKAIVDKAIYESSFDTVIFDEASMAYIPQIVFASSLAVKHFICLGDYSQLPPIVQSGDTNDLNCDIFRYCGIAEAIDRSCGHEWLCMLDTQYRMHPDIAEFASRTMYHGLLKSDEHMAERRSDIVDSDPFPGDPFHLVDTSGIMAVRSKNNDYSRFNLLSALISMGVAIRAAKKHEVGVVTPYNAQSKLLRALALDLMESKARLKPIKCSTVHQFQGSEKDVIIFDAVDSNIKGNVGRIGKPLRTEVNDETNRLFNVAVTRAKGKLISVVNVDYMETKLSDVFNFRQLIDSLDKKGKKTTADNVIKEFGGKALKSFTSRNGSKGFLNDISVAEKEIVIDLPGGTSETKAFMDRLAEKLSEVKSKGVKVTVRTDAMSTIPKSMRPLTVQSVDVTNPVALIDRKIVWYGLPSAGKTFFSKAIKGEGTSKPILRCESERLCRTLYGLLKITTE